MPSPFRVYNFVHRIFKTETTELIMLNKVANIELKNKVIKFTMDEQNSFFGNFILFMGGGAIERRLYFDTNEQAKKEFEDIKYHLTEFYKKS